MFTCYAVFVSIPLVVAVVNTKGGVGKTTTAMFLGAYWSSIGKRVVVLDLDKQGSATEWADRAVSAGAVLGFAVEPANTKRLVSWTARTDVDVVVLDTPPADAQIIDAAIGAASFVVVPTQASGLDTARVWETLPILTRCGVPYGVLLTSARLGTTLLDQATQAFTEHAVSCFDTVIPLRENIRDAFGTRPHHWHGYHDVAHDIEKALN